MNRQTITVMLADDTLIAREGWKRIFETADDISVITEGTTPTETIRKAIEAKPNVLLMDLKWGGDDTAGQTAIREIKKKNPAIKIVAITAYDHLIRDARAAGADAALLKTFTREELLSTIRDLVQQDVNLQLPEPPPGGDLTEREMEVLQWLAKGKTDKEIATILNIASTTVKNHVKNILSKLEAGNRTEAANIARERGLLR